MAVNVDWIKRLTLAAAVVHALMFIVSLVVRIQHNNLTPNQMNPNGFLYQYYKPDILGDFNSTKSKPSHAIENIDQAYTQRCSGSKNESGNKLLVLKAEFDVDNARRAMRLTWIPVQFHFMGHYNIDGYVLLMLIFGFSAFFEGVSYYFLIQSESDDYEYELTYSERPCMWRWMEYAVTSPIQILLVASSLMVRDVYTLYMMLFAQVALVQLGFAVEYAISAKGDDCTGLNVSDIFGVDEAFHYPMHFGSKTALLQGPKTNDGREVQVSVKKNPCLIDRLFWFSFSPAWLLHGAIWGILIQYFAHQDVECDNQGQNWKGMLIAVVTTQAVGFTSFAVIPILQALKVGILPAYLNVTEYLPSFLDWFHLNIPKQGEQMTGAAVLHWAFWYYTLLSLVVKVALGVTYMSFVTFFPFATDEHVGHTF